MKKVLAIMACAVAIAFAGILAGCGGEASSDGTADFIWYKAQIPEGFELDTYHGTTCASAEFTNSETEAQIFPSYSRSSTAEEEVASDLSIFSDWTAGDDVEYNGITWKTVDFTWNDEPSVCYYTDVQGIAVIVDAFEIPRGDAAIETFLGSITFPDDLSAALDEALDTDSSSVKF